MHRRCGPVLACTLALAACGGGGSGAAPQVRAANVVYQPVGAYDVQDNGNALATALTSGQSGGLVAVSGNTSVVTFFPSGTTTAAATASFGVTQGINDTVFILGSGATVQARVVSQSSASVSPGKTELDFVSVFPAQTALDWYVSAPSDSLPGSPDLSALGDGVSGTSSGVVSSTALLTTSGTARLRAVATGDGTRAVVFDSGPITLISASRLLLAERQTSGSVAPFSLLALADDGSSGNIRDQRVAVRIGQFSLGNGAADVFVDPPGTANTAATLFAAGVQPLQASVHAAQLPGAYRVSLANAGQTAELLGGNVSLAAGTSVSLFSSGIPGQSGTLAPQWQVITDDLSAPPVGMSRLRLVHLAPDLGAVDGVMLDPSASTPTVISRWIPDLSYAGASAQADLAPGTYALAVTLTGQALVLPAGGPQVINLSAGQAVTVVIAGCLHPGVGVCGNTAQSLVLVPLVDRN